MNRGIITIKRNPTTNSKFSELDKYTFHIYLSVHVALTTNDDPSSQIGFVIYIFDMKNTRHVYEFSSKKSRKMKRSIMACKVCSFMDVLMLCSCS